MRLIFPIVIYTLLILFANSLFGAVTPEFIRSLPPLPRDAVEELKKHENFELATGKIDVATVSPDNDIAYGLNPDEITDAKEQRIIKSTVRFPTSIDKETADWWMEHVTIPTYRSIVRKTVKVPLNIHQEAALVFFVQNSGHKNLETLVNSPNRLNSGNYESVSKFMPLYYAKEGRFKAGLQKRMKFQIALFEGKPYPRK